MVMVTHHLPDIIPEISRVIVMKDGRVSLDGPKADVLTSETLSDLFQISAEVVERDGYYQVW
jgi:iron complex transport system ATP-binding protein